MKTTGIAAVLLIAMASGCAMDEEEGLDGELGVDTEALFDVDEGGLPEEDVVFWPGSDPLPATCVPAPTDDAEGGFNVILLRYLVQDAGDAVIENANAEFEENDVDYELRWAPGAMPLECGYECFTPPGMRETTYTDQPNTCYAGTTGQMHFVLDLGYTFSRDIYVNIDFGFFCVEPEQDGGGQMVLRQAAPRTHVEGGGLLEDVLDFFAAGSLTDYIDAKVNEHLPRSGSSSVTNLDSRCETLGVIRNYPDDEYANNDAVIWDVPERRLFDRSALTRSGTVSRTELAPAN